MRPELIHMRPEVAKAIEASGAVVALETTIISHGMPYPVNYETAMAVEGIVRAAGAIPATVGIIGGEIRVGLTEEEIRFFATSKEIIKAGERDLPLVTARKLHAATTGGAAMAIAAASGIRVFVTGGIGAVGPGAGETFDISADLMALADYPCLTVCAGAKAFMDIRATLEYLETHRVPIMVYQSEYFPLFFTHSSGLKVDWVARDVGDIAECFAAKLRLGMKGGMLVGVPLPEELALPEDEAHAAIETALKRIEGREISGKEVTPFLLSAIKEETGGKSLEANMALIKNNAQIGALIAAALASRIKDMSL